MHVNQNQSSATLGSKKKKRKKKGFQVSTSVRVNNVNRSHNLIGKDTSFNFYESNTWN